jgi:hypothetical protein
MGKRMMVVTLALLVPLGAHAAGVPLVDAGGESHGSVAANLAKGSVKMKITGLAPLPAQVPGTSVTAFVYKAYLTSSADPAVEVFLADVYPNAKQSAKPKVAFKGDLSRLGLDRVIVVAFSKDAREAIDLLTATLGQ